MIQALMNPAFLTAIAHLLNTGVGLIELSKGQPPGSSKAQEYLDKGLAVLAAAQKSSAMIMAARAEGRDISLEELEEASTGVGVAVDSFQAAIDAAKLEEANNQNA